MFKTFAAGVLTVLLAVSTSASVSAAKAPVLAKPTKAEKACTKLDKVAARLQERNKEPSANAKQKLAQLNAACPPVADVTISTDGCIVTAQGPVGAVITYGAQTADGLRGWD